ncbi:MAG: aspartate/glutamate racemase family protein [Clostridia bacterium]|nr:aspartate/glutamate racemase family protein [Clostridia bacterium]
MENLYQNPEVCFFDSGIGGISLLYECVRRLPRVNFTYFADNYRVPYGSLPQEELIKAVDTKFQEIESRNPVATVVACNTATARCIDFLRGKYKFEIVGIQPAVKPAVEKGNCVVLATPATSESRAIKELVEKYGRGRTQVFACLDLAAYVENNVFALSNERVKAFLPKVKADAIVLGCTHYVFCRDIISDYYGCAVFDGIDGTAEHLCKILGNFDHREPRAQKIAFSGGDMAKNRQVFNTLMIKNGSISQNHIS